MDLKIICRMLKSELSSFYKKKVVIIVLLMAALFILLAPSEYVFSENVISLGLADSLLFRFLLSTFIVIYIPITVILIRKLKDLWDALF